MTWPAAAQESAAEMAAASMSGTRFLRRSRERELWTSFRRWEW